MSVLSESDEMLLRETVAAALGLSAEELLEDASMETVAAWTSLHHLSVMAAVEEAFGKQFSMDEMASVHSLADLRHLITA